MNKEQRIFKTIGPETKFVEPIYRYHFRRLDINGAVFELGKTNHGELTQIVMIAANTFRISLKTTDGEMMHSCHANPVWSGVER